MAATVTTVHKTVFGDQRFASATVALDDSYPNGGYAISISTLFDGWFDGRDDAKIIVKGDGASGGFLYEYLPSTGKLEVRSAAGGTINTQAAAVADTTDVSACEAVIYAVG